MRCTVPQVEVRMREGQAINIHMFCARRPGILLATMTALESMGIDIEQAVISCFNGFAMDVFRAEVCGRHIIAISSSDVLNSTKPNVTHPLHISAVSSSNAGMVLGSGLMKSRPCCCTLLVCHLIPTQCSWSENRGLEAAEAELFILFWVK